MVEVGLFWDISSDEFIRIFDAALLPRGVRIGKIDYHIFFSPHIEPFCDEMVCDDPLTYTPKNLEDHPLKKILGRRRQMRCDVLFMAHSFMRLPPMFFSYVTDYVVYNTDLGDVDKRKTDLGQHYAKIRQMVQNANHAAAQNPHYCEIYKTGL